jgi:hypothetical protein
MVIQNSTTLQDRLDFAARKRPGPDARFSTQTMTLDDAKAEFAAGRAHTRERHVAACTPRTEALAVPVGWAAFAGTVIAWLLQGGAFQTRSGSYNVNAQIYHLLEYFVSAIRKSIAGENSDTFPTDLLQ